METALGSDQLDGQQRDRTSAPMMMDFGDYELLGEIGRGGQGVVFRARQKSLNRTVALKVIGLGHWATETHIKRFRQEAEAAASLDHPRIVPIYEIGERDGSCYFSMKCIEGGQLDEVIARKPIPIAAAVELIVKLARTVQYAHERGILHRDIKPGNILIDASGEPHLTDFGLARLVENESTITRTMEVLGTPSYIAPEQAAGVAAELTRATDVYGLGAVFYQLLTGQPPFAGGTTFETIRLVLESEPRHPRLWNAKVDRELATICLKCLEKDPQGRYSSALALAEDLERWLRHEPIRARPTGAFLRAWKWTRRNPAIAVLLPLLIALATIVGVMFWRSKPSHPPAGIAVLPFDNLSGDKDDAVLADGLQDDVLTKLAKVADLKVISRTSVMHYRDDRDVRKIGRALNVSHVLEGSMRRSDGRIRLNAQLIDARTDHHVWAEQYDREITDVFALQSELAQKIASQLSSRISAAERKAIETVPTHDLEAYGLYIEAKRLSRFSSASDSAMLERLSHAAELLEQAVARDPNFALAYSLLTEVDLMLYWIPGRADATRRSRAKSALGAAQGLAPDTGETHLARAHFYHYGNRDDDHALEELDVAARLLPNNAEVFDTSAKIERRLGRWKEALRHFSKASELDPRDPGPLTQMLLTHMMLRHFDEAGQTANRGIASFPETADQFWDGKGEVGLAQADLARARTALDKMSASTTSTDLHFRVLLYEGKSTEAMRFAAAQMRGKDADFTRYFGPLAAQAARAAGATEDMRGFLLAARDAYEPLLPESDPGVLSSLGLIDALLGRNEESLRESQKAVELRPATRDAVEGPQYSTNLAEVYLLTGDRGRAIEQLSSVVKVPNGPSYGELKLDPIWNDLRDHPRFTEILAEAAKPIDL